MTIYDQYGNVTANPAGRCIEATAHGPATAGFLQAADGSYRCARPAPCLC